MSTKKRFLVTALTVVLAVSLLLPSVMQRPAADTQTGFILLSPGRDGQIGTSDDIYVMEKGDIVKGAAAVSLTDAVPSNSRGKTVAVLPVSQISGGFYTLAVSSNIVWAWGYNNYVDVAKNQDMGTSVLRVYNDSTTKRETAKKRQKSGELNNRQIEKSDEPNNKQIIAELVRHYRAIDGIKPEPGDYPLIGRMYIQYGYDRVLECIYGLRKKVENGFMPENPKLYLMGMLKKKKQRESLETDKSAGTTPMLMFSPEIEKAVKEVFDYYLEVFDGLLNGKMTLTEQRKAKIAERLMNGYTVEDIKTAIENIRCSDFHCGQNKNGIFYATIEFICANDTRLEEWINKVPPEKRTENQRLREIEKLLKSLGY